MARLPTGERTLALGRRIGGGRGIGRVLCEPAGRRRNCTRPSTLDVVLNMTFFEGSRSNLTISVHFSAVIQYPVRPQQPEGWNAMAAIA